MKKTYIAPNATAVALNADTLLAGSVSSQSLDGTSFGGNASTNNITESDAKGLDDFLDWD